MEGISKLHTYTGSPEWHSVYTVQLGELIEDKTFDWNRSELDWKAYAYDEEQYTRICRYFMNRYFWDEISCLPIKQWFMILQTKIIYELCPKFNPLYKRIADGFNPLGIEDEYYKSRKIHSDYPETLLSKNADYITSGNDEEWERIKEGETVERVNAYVLEFNAIDKSFIDELQTMFCSMYSANANGW